ncbi:hypothetical protein ACHWQZ_G003094 [Mnemiopsis leidyi]
MSIDNESEVDQVKNLPNTISTVKSSSDRISQINVKHITRHEKVLSHYESDIKSINSEVNEKLKLICLAAKEQISLTYCSIDSHLASLKVQDKFTSVDQFNCVWHAMKNEASEIISQISDMESDIMELCEQARINAVKKVMTFYFDKIGSAGVLDHRKLAVYLDSDLLSINLDLLKNYRQYVNVICCMKTTTIFRLTEYQREWEKQLLGWRDFLVQKNLSIVHEMLLSDEFRKPGQLRTWREKAFLQLNESDEMILDLYREIIKALPYISKRMTPMSLKISEIMQSKQRIAKNFLDNASVHHKTQIKKLEQKLNDIKDFLSREASCNEDQFWKSFSKFVQDGDESYERVARNALDLEEKEITQNLDVMTEIHSYMMQFLFSVSETWEDNVEKIKSHRKQLLESLKSCRDRHNSSSKTLEREIDKILSKISEASSSIRLDKLLEKVKSKLNELEQKLKDLSSEMESLILVYPEKCFNQISSYELSMLRLIGLKKVTADSQCDEATTLNRTIDESLKIYSKTVISGQIFERCSPHIMTQHMIKESYVSIQTKSTTETLVDIARQVIVDHLSSNNRNYKKTYELLILKLQNEISKEAKVREDVHRPRKKLIFEEFQARKRELDCFEDSLKRFYKCFDEFKEKLSTTENTFATDANAVIMSTEEKIEEACKKQLSVLKSADLKSLNASFEPVLWKLEYEISDKAKVVLSGIDKDAKKMRETEEKFSEYAMAGNYEMAEKTKNLLEFSEIADQVRNLTVQSKRNIKHLETQKNKKISTAVQSYKSHYKHCLLNLFFLEMRSMHLARVKMQIKCASSQGDSNFPRIEDQLEKISQSILQFDISNHSDDIHKNMFEIASSLTEWFRLVKTLINFYNFRCSPINVPAKSSLDELNQKYNNFSAPDSSVEDTVEFTRNILEMTSNSVKNCNALKAQQNYVEDDNNWIAESSNIEKKYLTGKITCVYGVGANILDVANQPWSNPSASSAQIPVNSFWLSKNPEGLEALKGLQTVKNIKERLCKSPPKNALEANSSGSKLKEISAKIWSVVSPAIESSRGKKISNDCSWTKLLDKSLTGSSTSDNTALDKPSLTPAVKQPNPHENELGCDESTTLTTQISKSSDNECKPFLLPAIAIMKKKENNERKSSMNQMNMAKVLNLNKTVDLLRRPSTHRRKRLSTIHKHQNTPIYDFLVMADDELKTFVFEPLKFFNLVQRRYNVNDVCDNIISLTEKVKFYLLHLQEDFIIACLLFYRQRHLSIKYRQKMKLNHESAINDFTEHLKKYMRNVSQLCSDRIVKIKGNLASMYKTFTDAPTVIFEKIHFKFKNDFSLLFDARIVAHQTIYQKVKDKQIMLQSRLNPCLSHPEHNETFDELCSCEKDLLISNELLSHYNESMKLFADSLNEFESIIGLCSEKLIKAAESAIQVEDIRRMTTKEENIFEVQKRLRQNLVVTTSLPISINKDRANSAKVNLVNYKNLHGTISRLIFSVLQARDKVLTHFRNLYSCQTKIFSSCHLKSAKELENWHRMWAKSVCQIKALLNNNC